MYDTLQSQRISEDKGERVITYSWIFNIRVDERKQGTIIYDGKTEVYLQKIRYRIPWADE
jgi:hypothetical protein